MGEMDRQRSQYVYAVDIGNYILLRVFREILSFSKVKTIEHTCTCILGKAN